MSPPVPERTDPSESDYAHQVRRKSERMRKARARGGSGWRTLATVGTLGWMLALPVVAGAMIGQVVSRASGRPALALLSILVGLGIGLYTTWRYVRRSFGDTP